MENDQVFQYIELNDEPAYSTNAKRLIKKAEQFEYEFLEDVSDLVTFYHENTREKIGLPVITSYSIHYTKLYEFRSKRV